MIVRASGDEVTLAVEDHGIGIPKARPGPDLRAVLQGRPGPAADRRHRAGSRDRAARRSSSTAAGSGSSPRRDAARRSSSRCRSRSERRRRPGQPDPHAAPRAAHRIAPAGHTSGHGLRPRRDPEHPQPRRSLGRAAAAAPGRHGRPPAGRPRPPGGRLPAPAGPPDRRRRRGPLREHAWVGRTAGVRQRPAGPRRRWWPRTPSGSTSGLERSAIRATVTLAGGAAVWSS